MDSEHKVIVIVVGEESTGVSKLIHNETVTGRILQPSSDLWKEVQDNMARLMPRNRQERRHGRKE